MPGQARPEPPEVGEAGREAARALRLPGEGVLWAQTGVEQLGSKKGVSFPVRPTLLRLSAKVDKGLFLPQGLWDHLVRLLCHPKAQRGSATCPMAHSIFPAHSLPRPNSSPWSGK